MTEQAESGGFSRALTPIERMFMWSPHAIVTLVARVHGRVNERMLREAVDKVRQRHPALRSRIVEGNEGELLLATDGAGEEALRTIPRQSDDHWIAAAQEASLQPFDFGARTPVRFLLLESGRQSDIVIQCHHVICDGLSLAYVARDLLAHLGDPARAVEPLPEAVPVGRENMPLGVALNPIVRMAIGGSNRRWAHERVIFGQEDYRSLHRAYWARYPHRLLPVTCDEDETDALAERCRSHGVTVTSALAAAFAGAQVAMQGVQPALEKVGVAADLRDRLPRPPGEAVGYYAGMVTPRVRYDMRQGFWQNARRWHAAAQRLYDDRHLFDSLLTWLSLDPTVLEGMHYKRFGALVPADAPRHARLAHFGARNDTVLALLKREGLDTLDRLYMGMAITNLGRLDIPSTYGALTLERLICKPGAGFPLSNVNLVVGAVTAAGRLSLVIEYVEDNLSPAAVEAIRDRALAMLRE